MQNFTVTTKEDSVEILVDLGAFSQEQHQHLLQKQPLKEQHQFLGGYDCAIFLNSETLPSKYTCIICTSVQREPTIVSCCGQHFCSSCLQKCFAARQRRRCPHCLSEEIQYFVNKQQEREILGLEVRCLNHGRGCSWTGELRQMEKHI